MAIKPHVAPLRLQAAGGNARGAEARWRDRRFGHPDKRYRHFARFGIFDGRGDLVTGSTPMPGGATPLKAIASSSMGYSLSDSPGA